ncbi:MAG: Lipopolysaccharide biosynthesis protein RffA [Candidatus Moranbacteria bacterium GW2011_GWE1_35_17]|nr:MAG: Lipopolysaccharide biosynthesis protein RffA [Candidatus Moranbacteria bacterium GW2011_GWE1_35_17]KKP89562.1 MAG: Lipopolysaccharide biosynthesis protein RffA [Parcubacteria group bacterium GW2011_GWC1_36_108]HCU01669.1 dTDP-4-amino-4,6-dideoxygalactose transaminase [Candidatus Nomurabacteria bacterium]
MIPFNIPPFTGKEEKYLKEVIAKRKLSGDGEFTKKCNQWFEDNFKCKKALLTTSCSHALDMAAILIDIKEGDEVIMPSYTFVSTANAFALRGAKIVFVDIRPDTMNIDESLIEKAITNKTKVIVVVHYAGISCEMDTIMEIARKHNLLVIEDAAQGVMSKYKGKFLGTIGDIGCYSFHETKNYSSGEGGAIVLNNEKFVERAEIIREKGTNRSKFLRGQVDKYTWVDIGSSYLPSELNAAYLFAQLEVAENINTKRLTLWNLYFKLLKKLSEEGLLELPTIPDDCEHNAHMFYIKTKNLAERTELIDYLKSKDILSVFHYVPLHSSSAGIKYGVFSGEDKYTTQDSDRLIRLPMYYELSADEVEKIVSDIFLFYELKNNKKL